MLRRSTYIIICSIISISGMSQRVFRPTPSPHTYESGYPPLAETQSSICIPLKFNAPDLTIIENNICEFFSGTYYFEGWETIYLPYAGHVNYEVWREKPLDILDFHDSTFSVAEKLYYSADGHVTSPYYPDVSAQCGWDDEAAREVVLGYDCVVRFATDYYLHSSTKTRTIVNPNRCQLTYRNIDVTDKLNDKIKGFMDQTAENFDKEVQSLTSFKAAAKSVWDSLQKPLKIDDNLWLYLDLRRVSGGPILASTDTPKTIGTNIGLTLFPKIYYGSMPATPSRPLPRLGTADCKPSFEVHPALNVSFSDFTTFLNKKETGIVENPQQYGRRKLTIKSIEAYSSNKALVLSAKVELRAARSLVAKSKIWNNVRYFFDRIFYHRDGTIYLTGSPGFTPGTNEVYVDSLDFSIATKDVLTKIAAWVFHTKLKETLEVKARYDLSSKMNALLQQVNAQFNRNINERIGLSATLSDLRPEVVFLYSDHIVTRFILNGFLSVIVSSPY